MNITIACVGRVKEKFFRDAIGEYTKRLGRYARLSIREVKDEPAPENASPALTEKIKETEGIRLLKLIPDSSYVIALAINGKPMSSEELATFIDKSALSGKSHLVFVIGGSLGLSDQVIKRADFLLSFSRMTFPHQLMRVVLLEQIYRSFRIINHEPYHK